MNDIKIINEHFVRMQKILWDESEVILGRCFNFNIDIENGIVIADLKVTSKRSLFEFIKLSFKSFSESPLTESERNEFYASVQRVYERIYEQTEPLVSSVLPYYERLYIHQKDTIFEALPKKKNLLALDRRLGKTVISASLSRLDQARRTVVICPAIAKYDVWFKDLCATFGFNELYFTVYDASKYRTIKAFNERFVIINYDIVAKFEKELIAGGIDHFIFDECHRIKNHKTARFKNIKRITDQFPNARMTFLSGTPIRNRVNDVFAYLNLSGHELGSSYKKFLDEYTIKSIGRFSKITGGKNLQDLYAKMSNFMIRKTRDECTDLPANTHKSYVFKLDDYRDEYDKIIEQLAEQKEHSALSGNLHSLNIITAKAKMQGIIELAEDIIENEGKVVLFSNYTEPLKYLENYFRSRCVMVNGTVEASKRSLLADKFRSDDSVEVFLGNMEAAGEAINLAVASEIIIIDFPLVPGPLEQACDRCIQMGKYKAVNINYTFCEGSIDEYLHDLLVEKTIDINILLNKGKDAITRDNMTEVLINKLLKKDGEDNISTNIEPDFLSVDEAAPTTEKTTGYDIIMAGDLAITVPKLQVPFKENHDDLTLKNTVQNMEMPTQDEIDNPLKAVFEVRQANPNPTIVNGGRETGIIDIPDFLQ